jgi:hypothetical protein
MLRRVQSSASETDRSAMHRHHGMIFLSVWLAIVLWASPAILAATVSAIKSSDCKVLLQGAIIEGDTERLKAVMSADNSFFDENREVEGDQLARLCLDSRGGSLLEGTKLARYLLEEGIGTVIRADDECLSACAIAFMGGRNLGAEEDFLNRRLHHRGKLGFHRPSFPLIEGKTFSSEAINNAVQAGVDAVLEFMRLANERVSFGSEPVLNSSLVEEMLKYKGNNLLVVDTVEKAGRWGIEVFGYSPPTSIDDKSVVNACDNWVHWLGDLATPAINYKSERNLTKANANGDLKKRGYSRTFEIFSSRAGYLGSTCTISAGDKLAPLMVCATDEGLSIENRCVEGYYAEFLLFAPTTKLADLPSEPGKQSSGQISQKATPPREFQEESNMDIVGSDLARVENASAQQCRMQCEKRADCAAATFDRWNRLCILKGSATELLVNSKSVSWLSSESGAKKRDGASRLVRKKERAFPDKPYRTSAGNGYAECEAICKNDQKCMGVTWHHAGQCDLLDHPSEYQPSGSSDIAYKAE